MKKLYEKSEIWFAVIWIIAYVVLFSAADSLSESLGVLKSVNAPLGVLLSVILFVWIRKNGLSEKYGLIPFKGSWKNYLYFVPLFLIMSVSLWNGVTLKFSAAESTLRVLSMIGVGFLEEVIFRGFLFTIIFYKGKSLLPCIITHSVINSLSTFGVDGSLTYQTVIAVALCVISVAYTLWILKKDGMM